MKGDIVLDTSILIEIALATNTGRKLLDLIVSGDIKPYTTTTYESDPMRLDDILSNELLFPCIRL